MQAGFSWFYIADPPDLADDQAKVLALREGLSEAGDGEIKVLAITGRQTLADPASRLLHFRSQMQMLLKAILLCDKDTAQGTTFAVSSWHK